MWQSKFNTKLLDFKEKNMNYLRFLAITIMALCLSICSVYSYQPDPNYRYQLAAALVFQNEADHLKEWIEYHKLVGFDHFYLYNNSSTDNYLEVLQPYVLSGDVELYECPRLSNSLGEHIEFQCTLYNKALALARGKVKWLALIDGDEYIAPLHKRKVLDVLKNYEDFGGLYLNWLVFGTSHVDRIPQDRLMIEMLNHCQAEPTGLGKSIVRPERVENCTDPHRMWYKAPYFHVNTNRQEFDWVPPVATDKMLIFHYYTKDLYFLVNVKFPRVSKWVGIELNSYIRDTEVFNAVYNPLMMRFVPKLKEQMGMK